MGLTSEPDMVVWCNYSGSNWRLQQWHGVPLCAICLGWFWFERRPFHVKPVTDLFT